MISMRLVVRQRLERLHAAKRQIAQEDTGQQLSEHRRLLQSRRELATELGRQEQHGEAEHDRRNRIRMHAGSDPTLRDVPIVTSRGGAVCCSPCAHAQSAMVLAIVAAGMACSRCAGDCASLRGGVGQAERRRRSFHSVQTPPARRDHADQQSAREHRPLRLQRAALPSSKVLPAWTREERFDIAAKAAGPITDEQRRLMMRALLVERFRLKARFVTREKTIYVMTTARADKQLGTGPHAEARMRNGAPRQAMSERRQRQIGCDPVEGGHADPARRRNALNDQRRARAR